MALVSTMVAHVFSLSFFCEFLFLNLPGYALAWLESCLMFCHTRFDWIVCAAFSSPSDLIGFRLDSAGKILHLLTGEILIAPLWYAFSLFIFRHPAKQLCTRPLWPFGDQGYHHTV
jgi:hypothetical protein